MDENRKVGSDSNEGTSRVGKWSGRWHQRKLEIAEQEKFSGADTLGITGERSHKLSEWFATAICGNDISSSCLYVAGLATAYAGYLSPFALLIVAVVLFFFRYIYAEVGDALPLNGGAYNCLLNTTTKYKASVAAALTILSYVATAVISANAAMSYFRLLIDAHALTEMTSSLEPPAVHGLIGYLGVDNLMTQKQLNEIPALLGQAGHATELFTFVNIASAGVILVFAALAIMGITESARVALGIFLFHMTTLLLFCGIGIFAFIQDPSVLSTNWLVLPQAPDGESMIGFGKALFLGFAAALLGISGFALANGLRPRP